MAEERKAKGWLLNPKKSRKMGSCPTNHMNFAWPRMKFRSQIQLPVARLSATDSRHFCQNSVEITPGPTRTESSKPFETTGNHTVWCCEPAVLGHGDTERPQNIRFFVDAAGNLDRISGHFHLGAIKGTGMKNTGCRWIIIYLMGYCKLENKARILPNAAEIIRY
jgi:hypothetical protein